jgi:hypothetical protein
MPGALGRLSLVQAQISQAETMVLGITSNGAAATNGDAAAKSSAPVAESFIGSIDQGTTSTRFLIFNKDGEPVASHQIEFKQIYPQPG